MSWIVLAVWWGNAAAAVGILPALLFLVILTLTMLGGHAWAYRATRNASDVDPARFGFHQGTYLGLLGHLFLFMTAIDSTWSIPPWPLFAALGVLTLALTATSIAVFSGELHAAGTIAAAIIVFAWSRVPPVTWAPTILDGRRGGGGVRAGVADDHAQPRPVARRRRWARSARCSWPTCRSAKRRAR